MYLYELLTTTALYTLHYINYFTSLTWSYRRLYNTTISKIIRLLVQINKTTIVKQILYY